jgi:membrane dipeptidase
MRALTRAEEARALALHHRSIVIDALNASIMNEEYFEKMRQGGVTATNFTIAMNHNLSETVKLIAAMHRQLHTSHAAIAIESSADITAAKSQGKTGILLGFQNIGPFEGDISLLATYYRLGIRIIQLTYHFRNICGDGCMEPGDCGLSMWGKELIRQMNDLGMVVDLAHTGERTAREAIAASRHPVVCSHSNSFARLPQCQNKSDETVQALARKGGVIALTAFPRLLEPDPTLDTLLDHVDHMVRVAGVDHVGIGLDLAEGWSDSPIHRQKLLQIDGRIYDYPEGIQTVCNFPNITRGLVSRGYSDEDMAKILGGNLVRVFKEVIG